MLLILFICVKKAMKRGGFFLALTLSVATGPVQKFVATISIPYLPALQCKMKKGNGLRTSKKNAF